MFRLRLYQLARLMNDRDSLKQELGRGSLNGLLPVLLIAAAALVIWQLSHVLLLTFGGLLIAVFLRYSACAIARWTRLPAGAGLVLVIAAIILAIASLVSWLGPQTVAQFETLWASMPAALDRVEASMQTSEIGRLLLDGINGTEGSEQPDWNIVGTLGGTLSTTFGIIFEVIIVLTIAVFFAADPKLYRRGVLHLVPLAHRARAVEILDTLSNGLWHWLIGQFASMLLVGVVAGVGLMLLGVPLAAVLGLIAGLTNFIPQVGPYIAAVPAVLIAFTIDPMIAVYTALLFLAIHQVEGNIILPLIQKRATDLPPVLTVIAVVAGGVLFGVLGLLLATPLLYVIMVLVRMIYVESMLGDTMGANPELTLQPMDRTVAKEGH